MIVFLLFCFMAGVPYASFFTEKFFKEHFRRTALITDFETHGALKFQNTVFKRKNCIISGIILAILKKHGIMYTEILETLKKYDIMYTEILAMQFFVLRTAALCAAA